MTSSDQPMDHVPPNEQDQQRARSDMENNVRSRDTWIRLLYMLLFGFFYALSRVVTVVVVVVQFFQVLLGGETNENLKSFGRSLAIYAYQVVSYLTFNTETKPYPLELEWPATEAAEPDLEPQAESRLIPSVARHCEPLPVVIVGQRCIVRPPWTAWISCQTGRCGRQSCRCCWCWLPLRGVFSSIRRAACCASRWHS